MLGRSRIVEAFAKENRREHPTVVQAVGGVGVARLLLTLPCITTKNILVSTGAHILNDWATFSLSVVAGMRTAGG